MKKSLIAIGIIVVIIVILGMWWINLKNRMVTANNDVKAQWGNVENQYQRRANLIPNLVATVKGYATHESGTLEAVVSARSKATQITVDPTNLTPEKLQEYQAAQGQLSQALGRLLMITENYPDLKANENFKDLQVQLEQTENRISTEITRFNDKAKDFNNLIEKVPNNIIAGISGYQSKPYFKAEEGSQTAPKVDFSK